MFLISWSQLAGLQVMGFSSFEQGRGGGGVDSAFGAAAKSSVFLARHDVK